MCQSSIYKNGSKNNRDNNLILINEIDTKEKVSNKLPFG